MQFVSQVKYFKSSYWRVSNDEIPRPKLTEPLLLDTEIGSYWSHSAEGELSSLVWPSVCVLPAQNIPKEEQDCWESILSNPIPFHGYQGELGN